MTTPVSGVPPVAPGLPRAGSGGVAENTGTNFLLLGSIVMGMYLAGVAVVRMISGRRAAMEDDGITGL